MPRIHDVYADCAVYIYESVDDAKNGERQGGSGFIVHVEFEENLGFGPFTWCRTVT